MNLMTTVATSTALLRRSMQGILRQFLFFLLFSVIPGHLLAATYYVDASNPGSGTGTIGDPWQKISSVNSATFAPGDNILFKRGEVWHESLVVPYSGSSSQPITFGAYGSGDLPLFDGTYSGSIQWEPVPGYGNIYRTSLPSWPSNPGLLLYKGVVKAAITTLQFGSVPTGLKKGAILLQMDSHYSNLWVTSKSGNTVSGITFFTVYENENVYVRQLNTGGIEEAWASSLGHPTITTVLESLTEPGHWYWKDNAVYLYSDADPTTLDVKIGQRLFGINTNGKSYLNIRDLAVQGFKDTGVLLTGTQGSIVQNMRVSAIGAASPYKTGILIHNSTNNIIRNNRVESVLRVGIGIYANSSNNSHGNNVIGNTVLNSGSTGINLSTDGPGSEDLIRNNTIDGNTVERANTLSYDAAGIYALYIGTGNILKNNIIRNGGTKELRSAGVMIDGGSSPLEIASNTVDNNSLGGIVVTGTGHNIHHNTLRNNGVSSWECAQIVFFPVSENASACTVMDNTLEARGNLKLFLVTRNPNYTSGEQQHTLDSNTYRSQSTDTFCWSDTWECDGWIDFNSWKNTSGQDAHSSFSLITLPPARPPGKSLNGVYLLLK